MKIRLTLWDYGDPRHAEYDADYENEDDHDEAADEDENDINPHPTIQLVRAPCADCLIATGLPTAALFCHILQNNGVYCSAGKRCTL